jgi:hypothetical protein
MNIFYECSDYVTAKACNCEDKNKKIVYSFNVDNYILCKDKRDIIFSEIAACEKLLRYSSSTNDVSLITDEINELKLALDLIH